MAAADAFRRALAEGDISACRRLWAIAAPHLPQPETDEQAAIVMHRARTEAESLPLPTRAWSHRWLIERGLPSGLPEHLKPKAERIETMRVEAVGISVNFRSPYLKPVAEQVRGAMEQAVLDAHSQGRMDAPFVQARMAEAKGRTLKALLG